MEETTVVKTYHTLTRLLNSPPASIEIFPGGADDWCPSTSEAESPHAPFLFEDGNLGVPQKVLYQTYMVGVKLFRKPKASADLSDEDFAHVLASTSVILLANPAHQTALNARMRVIRPVPIVESEFDAQSIVHELKFVAALLSVRECAKESLLWHYRRWLLQSLHPSFNPDLDLELALPPPYSGKDVNAILGFPLETITEELRIASRACEMYPRNYHAWLHRRLCMQAILYRVSHFNLMSSGTSSATSELPLRSDLEAALTFVEEESKVVRQWIERHVSDYSAVYYLCALTALARHTVDFKTRPELKSVIAPGKHPLLCHARSLLSSYPDHETLWLYLRAALDIDDPLNASQSREDAKAISQAVLFNITVPGVSGGDACARNAQLFFNWCERRTSVSTP